MDYANIILEILDRIKKLEQEVAELKPSLKERGTVAIDNDYKYSANFQCSPSILYSCPPSGGKRDTTRYMFDGNVYLKNRLVLAVVKAYVSQNTSITRQQLKQVFDKTLQGSIGVVVDLDEARNRIDYEKRFFAHNDEVIHLNDGDMLVCTQWGIGNIDNFVHRAEQLGFSITPIRPRH